MHVSEVLVPRGAGAAGYRWAAFGLLVLTVYGALLPFHFTPRPLSEAVESFRNIPSWDSSNLAARGDWVVSLVQYAALGFLLTAALCADSTRPDGPVAAVVAPACAALAIAIEFAQQFFPPRTVSWNDIVLECTGAAAGVAAWLAAGRRVARWVRRLATVTTVSDLAKKLMPAYIAGLLIIELMPFDFVIGGAELAVKYSEGRVHLTPFAGPFGPAAAAKAALNVVAFVPMGMLPLLSGVHSETSVDRPRWPGVALAGPVLVEVLQLFVYSRPFGATDILTGMAGVCGGWWLGRPRHVRRFVEWLAAPHLGPIGPAAWIGWLAAVAYVHWHPFDFTIDPASFAADSEDLPVYGLRRMTFAPFVDYYWGSKYNALDQFVRKGISFLPAGVLVALSVPQVFQPGAARRAVATALGIAVVLQIGRYFLPSHIPSVTDVLIECVAAWLGFRFTQYVRSVLWAETVFTTFAAPRSAPHLHFITPWRGAEQVRRSDG